MQRLDAWRLVFLDESSAQLGIRRTYAYAPIGERTHGDFLRNYGPNFTLISAMSLEGMLPSFLVEGSVTTEVLIYYLEHLLLPALSPGQVLVLDNFVIHKSQRVRELAATAGVELLVLPSYSPDLNPIEFAFSKIKHLLKQAEARLLPQLSNAVKCPLDAIMMQDIQEFLRGCGYNTRYL